MNNFRENHEGLVRIMETEEGKRVFNQERPESANLIQKRDCSSCLKFDTCLIWRMWADTANAINKQLEASHSKGLNATEIATVCPHFTPLAAQYGR